ncbi:tyrosine-type recombinase/integrase [Shewanella sp.]|uniref:tyrosine-type recombinase/integrase n=1 Tax=Shewanella sp. TaxID=50422 RepID=UPI0040488E58
MSKKKGNKLPDKVTSIGQANQVVKAGIKKRWAIGEGIYLRVSQPDSASWEYRYSINGKRYTETLGRYGRRPDGISFGDIRDKTVTVRHELKSGLRAPGSSQSSECNNHKTVDDLAQSWLKKKATKVQKLNIVEQRYNNWIKPKIGNRPFDKVKTSEIEDLVDDIVEKGFKTVANKVLADCKAIFNIAIKRRELTYNPAQLLDNSDAGGKEESRDRKLSVDEIPIVFEVFRQYSYQYTRENYLATALLLVLGVRKTELIHARWSEFNFDSNTWFVPDERVNKKGARGYPVPLVPVVIDWLNELKLRGNNSEYLFPARKGGSGGPMSESTLNAALQKLFGNGKSNGKNPYPNVFEDFNIEHFVIHDLRRTSRSLIRSKKFMGEHRASLEAACNGQVFLERF